MKESLLNFLKCAECNSLNLMLRSIEKFGSKKIKTGFIRCKDCETVFPMWEGRTNRSPFPVQQGELELGWA